MNTVEAIKHFFIGAGATWVLWMLGCLSMASVAVVVERWLCYRNRGGDLRALAHTLDRRLSNREFDEAIDDLATSPSVAPRFVNARLALDIQGGE